MCLVAKDSVKIHVFIARDSGKVM